jgi:hypothetical protein
MESCNHEALHPWNLAASALKHGRLRNNYATLPHLDESVKYFFVRLLIIRKPLSLFWG